jgi:hypothetical protein
VPFGPIDSLDGYRVARRRSGPKNGLRSTRS